MPLSGQLTNCILHCFPLLKDYLFQGLKLEPLHFYMQIKKCLGANTVQQTITSRFLLLLALAQRILPLLSLISWHKLWEPDPEEQASYGWPCKLSMRSGLCPAWDSWIWLMNTSHHKRRTRKMERDRQHNSKARLYLLFTHQELMQTQ